MAPDSEGDHRNYVVSSLPLSKKPTGTLTSPLLSFLPFDLVEEILCRLLVKILLQLKCICKSWKSVISNDRKFSKKHLRMSKNHLIVGLNVKGTSKVRDSPILSVFNSGVPQTTQLNSPLVFGPRSEICSCDGLLCFTLVRCRAILWNPSIRKYYLRP
ncbi:F-box and associated interaction domain protein [Medicago truncatula]|uniref:F-box and associated interaction domain protein n=1 Tax=Medicago truncatula TaxID=3880 RepID=G7JAY3_MEDTR|nr:F-box and associated interaction domain protein [Medicago truncatula]